jgi:hypothetical protein
MIDRPCDIYKVARQCGVKLFDGHLHSPTSRKPFECYCKPTVREIGREHGEDHLKLVFMLMTGNKTNAAELYADMITAVSHILIRLPEIERRPNLTAEFDRIDLGALRQKVKTMRLGIENWKHLASLLAERIYTPAQRDLLNIGEAA